MRRLYHLALSPHCRKVRIVLAEKGLDFELAEEPVWERRQEFLALNPAGTVPVLVEDSLVVADSSAISEYLDEAFPARPLIGFDPPRRAETRRLAAWFDDKMGREVTDGLVAEKVFRRLSGEGEPDSQVIRASIYNLHTHLEYVSHLVERRNWLAGEDFSLADIAAGAHFSCIDYLGDVPWDEYGTAREWYARIKSRPGFRAILADHLGGMPPPGHYADLDF